MFYMHVVKRDTATNELSCSVNAVRVCVRIYLNLQCKLSSSPTSSDMKEAKVHPNIKMTQSLTVYYQPATER